jgi:hypothetical protein
MLRPLYRCVLRLHPPGFRKRFTDEMLSIFERAAGTSAEFLLLLDALVSLARQWVLRPEFWDDLSPAQQPVPDGVPSFHTLAPFRPRTPAVIHGLLLSIALFCLTCFAIKYSWIHLLHVRIPEVQFDSPRSAQVNPSRESTTLERPTSAPVSGYKAAIALPPPLPTSVNLTKAPVAITARNSFDRSLVTAESSKSRPPSRFSSPVVSTAPSIEVTLQDYAGTYVAVSPGRLTILISAEGGHLMIEVAGQPKRALAPVSETKFVVMGADLWVEFVRDEHSTDGNRILQLRVFQGGQLFIAQRQ